VVRKGNVYINDVKISELYIKEKPLYVLKKKYLKTIIFFLEIIEMIVKIVLYGGRFLKS